MGGDETHFSQEEAIELAANFCRQIGAPIESVKATVCLVPETSRPSHYLPRLKVNFADQAGVEVAAQAPLICAYDNLALRRALRRQPVAPPISEAEAIRIATPIIQATGQAEELLLEGAHLRELSAPLYADGFSWIARWRRVFREIPYHDQHASVRLQASSGAPKDVTVVFQSPPPVNALFGISSQQADDIARAMLALPD